MFNNNRSESIAPSKGDDKVRNIKEELVILGGIKAQYELDIAEGKKLASTYQDLDKQVIIKQAELEQLEKDVDIYNSTLADSKVLLGKIDEYKEIIKTLQHEAETLATLKESLSKDITTLGEDKATKEAELNAAILDLETKLNKIKNEYITFERNAIKKVDEYDAKLSTKNEELDKLAIKVIDGEKELKTLTSNRARLSSELQSLNIAIEESTAKLATETARADAKYDERMAEFEEYKKTEMLKLDERDGELSIKSKFLDVRENFLRDVKSQLEDKLGKKIDNMNF